MVVTMIRDILYLPGALFQDVYRLQRTLGGRIFGTLEERMQ